MSITFTSPTSPYLPGAREHGGNGSLPLGIAIHILGMMPRKLHLFKQTDRISTAHRVCVLRTLVNYGFC